MSLRCWLAFAFVWIAVTGCGAAQSVSAFGRGEASANANGNGNRVPSVNVNSSPTLADALTREYGNYEDVVTWDRLMNDLENAQVVCIGEAHYDARDMETAFELTRALAAKKKIALAVERFSYDMQPALDTLFSLKEENAREQEIDALLQNKTYQTVWGTHAWDQTGFPVNTPSRPIFEATVEWAARTGIPIIALDISLEDRKKGLGEDMAYRNEFWEQQIEKFRKQHAHTNYQIIIIGGINHLTNAPNSLPSKLKTELNARVVSIGQRDAMYHYLNTTRLAQLANVYHLENLIVHHPQFALVNVKGVATFPNPPDYWITVHAPHIEN